MPRININFEVDDNLFDEASMQALKSKVRQLVQKECSESLGGRVEQAVNDCVRREANAIIKSFDQYWGTSAAREDMRKRLKEQAAQLAFSDEDLKRAVDKNMKPVFEYAEEAMQKIKKMIDSLDQDIERQVRVRVEAMFGAAFREALDNVVKKGEDE